MGKNGFFGGWGWGVGGLEQGHDGTKNINFTEKTWEEKEERRVVNLALGLIIDFEVKF